MGYEYITKYNSPNYTPGRQGNKVSEIIIHHWGTDGQMFMTPVNWLCRKNGTSSAHYVVENGRVACIVDCANTAWHAGNFAHNLKSIGIECRPEMSVGDLETTCELVADIYKVYGVLPILGHKDVSSTACPGRYYSKLGYIKQRAIEIMNGKNNTDPKPDAEDLYRVRKSWDDAKSQVGAFKFLDNAKKTCDKNPGYKVYNQLGSQVYPTAKPPKKSVDEIAKEVLAGKWGNGADRKNRLLAAGYDYNAVQNRVNQLAGGGSVPKMSARQFALEVWTQGKHGSGATREANAKRLGVNYAEAQRLINILASGGKI